MNISSVLRDHGVGTGIKPEGTAVPTDVLSGKTFINKDGKQNGSMLYRTGNVTGKSISRSGTTLRIKPQTGYVDDSSNVQWSDPNWIAGNIRQGVSIFGLAGTFGGGLARKQSGTIRIEVGTANATIPLSSDTNMSKAILRYNYKPMTPSTPIVYGAVLGYLTANTVNLMRYNSMQYNVDINWEVLELEGIKRIQRGRLTSNGISEYGRTITLAQAVNVDRSIIFFDMILGSSYNTASDYTHLLATYDFVNSTSFEVSFVTNHQRYWSWQVIEFE